MYGFHFGDRYSPVDIDSLWRDYWRSIVTALLSLYSSRWILECMVDLDLSDHVTLFILYSITKWKPKIIRRIRSAIMCPCLVVGCRDWWLYFIMTASGFIITNYNSNSIISQHNPKIRTRFSTDHVCSGMVSQWWCPSDVIQVVVS